MEAGRRATEANTEMIRGLKEAFVRYSEHRQISL